MKKKFWKWIDTGSCYAVIIGSVNWLFIGLFNFNIIEKIFGLSFFTDLIYVLVGISGVYKLIQMFSC